MATYVPNANELTQPTGDKPIKSSAPEHRAIKAKLARTLRVPEAGELGEFPAIAARAGRIAGFDAGGNPTVFTNGGVADPSLRADLADSELAMKNVGLIGYNGTLNYALQTLGRHIQDTVVNPADFPWLARFDDVTDDSAAINAAITWLNANGGGRMVMPRGIARCVSPIEFKNNIDYIGQGGSVFDNAGTMLRYVGTADAFKILNVANGSTAAFINIRGIAFKSTTQALNSCLFYDLASSLVTIKRCSFVSNRIGLALDQSELWHIENCYFGSGTTSDSVGIWFINGADKVPGNLAYFTNRILVQSCQFNGNSVCTAIYDDGGVAHAFRDNNFNGYNSHMIIVGVNGITIEGGEYEINAGPSIIFGITKKLLATGGPTTVARVVGMFHYNNLSQPAIATVALALPGCIRIEDNFYNLPGAVYTGMSNAADVIAQGNRQVGAGDGITLINNYYPTQTDTPGWSGATGAPAIGNGTIARQFTRAGREMTERYRLVAGTTTTFGTGAWSFSLKVPADVSTVRACGSAVVLRTGSQYYSGTAKINDSGTSLTIYISNGTGAVGSANPGGWVATDTLDFQITYPTAASI